MGNVQSVTAATFDEDVLRSELPVLVDIWASWCPPCKKLLPIVDHIAEKFSGRLKVVKCDYDNNSEVADRYHVLSIPHLLFFKDGKVVSEQVGFLSESELAGKVDTVLAASERVSG